MNSEQADTDQKIPVIEPGAAQSSCQVELPGSMSDQQSAKDGVIVPGGSQSRADQGVIWTPRFIVMFALTLVLGLSLESILTQGWTIHIVVGQWVFLGHVALICLCWIFLLAASHSRWTSLGAVFGIIWAAFMTINIIIQSILAVSTGPILAHVNVVICLALLGCYICFSVDRLLIGRWDAWLLGLTPVVGMALVALLFLLEPARSWFGLENSIAAVALILSALVWWIRPSCWKAAPGATFLFGATPILLLLLNVANAGYNTTNFFLARVVLDTPSNFSNRESIFLFAQVALLCLLLGGMRFTKYEIEV